MSYHKKIMELLEKYFTSQYVYGIGYVYSYRRSCIYNGIIDCQITMSGFSYSDAHSYKLTFTGLLGNESSYFPSDVQLYYRLCEILKDEIRDNKLNSIIDGLS